MGQLTRREEAKLKAAGQVGPRQLHAIRVIVKRNERAMSLPRRVFLCAEPLHRRGKRAVNQPTYRYNERDKAEKKKRRACESASRECNSLGNYPSRRRYNYDYITISDVIFNRWMYAEGLFHVNAIQNLSDSIFSTFSGTLDETTVRSEHKNARFLLISSAFCYWKLTAMRSALCHWSQVQLGCNLRSGAPTVRQ